MKVFPQNIIHPALLKSSINTLRLQARIRYFEHVILSDSFSHKTNSCKQSSPYDGVEPAQSSRYWKRKLFESDVRHKQRAAAVGVGGSVQSCPLGDPSWGGTLRREGHESVLRILRVSDLIYSDTQCQWSWQFTSGYFPSPFWASGKLLSVQAWILAFLSLRPGSDLIDNGRRATEILI